MRISRSASDGTATSASPKPSVDRTIVARKMTTRTNPVVGEITRVSAARFVCVGQRELLPESHFADSKSRLHSLDLREMPTDVHGVDVEDIAKIEPKGHPWRRWRPETNRIPIQRARRLDQREKACISREKCFGHSRARSCRNRSLRRFERFGLDQRSRDVLPDEGFAIRSTWRTRVRPRDANERFGGVEEERIH